MAAGEAQGLLGLAEFAWACRQAGRPCSTAILDGTPAPAVIDAGASLVVLDRTALGGPPCGIVAGEAVLLRAVRAQRQGVGRAFRPRPSDASAFPDRSRPRRRAGSREPAATRTNTSVSPLVSPGTRWSPFEEKATMLPSVEMAPSP